MKILHIILDRNRLFTCSVSFSFLCGSSIEGEWGLLGAAPLRPLVRSEELVLGGLIRGIRFLPTTVGMVLPATGTVGLATWVTDDSEVGEMKQRGKTKLYMTRL